MWKCFLWASIGTINVYHKDILAGPSLLCSLNMGTWNCPWDAREWLKLPVFFSGGVCGSSSSISSFYSLKEKRMFSHTTFFSTKPHFDKWKTTKILLTHTSMLCKKYVWISQRMCFGGQISKFNCKYRVFWLDFHMLSYLRCKYVF